LVDIRFFVPNFKVNKKNMSGQEKYEYIWRCAKCSHHLANIVKAEGVLKQEKKCPKCKSINVLNFDNGNTTVECRSLGDDYGVDAKRFCRSL